jgi:hypothetical protein
MLVITNSKKAIKNDYVTIGAKKFTVENGHTFQVGDRVILETVPNQAWD